MFPLDQQVESDGLAQLAFLASNEIDSQYGGDYVGAVGGQLGGGALIRAPNDRRKPLKLQQPTASTRIAPKEATGGAWATTRA